MLKKLSLLSLSALFLVLVGCDSKTADSVAVEEAPVAEVSTAAEAPTAEATATKAAEAPVVAETASEEIGVAECDAYVSKYKACINSVSGAAAAAAQGGLDMMVDSWKKSLEAGTPADALGKGCQMASDSAKTSMEAMGCEW
ncbi:MAG: PBP1b-binding outer membrane lipoprotein LpoB [Flavobacteriales bacterium]|jgi:PBP1b-binding outer membrane lipoprotein LpoB